MSGFRNVRYNDMDVTRVASALKRLLGSGRIRTPEDVPPVLRGWLVVKDGKITGIEGDIPKVSHAEMRAIERLERGVFKGRLPQEEEKI